MEDAPTGKGEGIGKPTKQESIAMARIPEQPPSPFVLSPETRRNIAHLQARLAGVFEPMLESFARAGLILRPRRRRGRPAGTTTYTPEEFHELVTTCYPAVWRRTLRRPRDHQMASECALSLRQFHEYKKRHRAAGYDYPPPVDLSALFRT